jgi:Leucine-rich repeat (LRR) protein
MRSEVPEFGQLRSWMNQDALEPAHREDLWQAIRQCALHHPQEFDARWRPYLRGFPMHWSQPLTTLHSLAHLEQAIEWLPFARFSLALSHGRLDDRDVEAWACSSALSRLSALCINGSDDGDEGTQALARSPHLVHLTYLELCGNQVTEEGVKALAASSHLAGLRTLRLRSNYIDDECARILAHSPFLARLKSLDLSDNEIGEVGIRALTHSPYLTALTCLDVADNQPSHHDAQ